MALAYDRRVCVHPIRRRGSPVHSRIGRVRNVAILASGNRLGVPCCQTLSAIAGDRPIDDRAAVDTLPRVENEKEIREPF